MLNNRPKVQVLKMVVIDKSEWHIFDCQNDVIKWGDILRCILYDTEGNPHCHTPPYYVRDRSGKIVEISVNYWDIIVDFVDEYWDIERPQDTEDDVPF